jgi:hypothetical protein
MQMIFVIVPPGGGEVNYSFDIQMPDAPRVGEYVMLLVDKEGLGAFRVSYVVHDLRAQPTGSGGHTTPAYEGAIVHIEPVKQPYNIEGSMKQLFDFYNENPRWEGKVQEFPESGY